MQNINIFSIIEAEKLLVIATYDKYMGYRSVKQLRIKQKKRIRRLKKEGRWNRKAAPQRSA
ncbi:MAG: hypothetical protein M1426_04685 [Patescibacteria group bacterium]|nr:hypothetical protein [Patescibacteria group bacterium]